MKKVLLLLLCALFATTAFSQKTTPPETYNYVQGVNLLRNDEPREALIYFNKELAENPKNGYAFIWIAAIRESAGEYGKALTAINNAIKYLPPKDKNYSAFAYSIRSGVYASLGEMEKALADISSAIKIEPDDNTWYQRRGQLYYDLKKYDLSDKDFKKMIELDEGDPMGYMYLGRNANTEERYQDAVKLFDHVVKLAPEYVSGYSFRAESYFYLKQYNEAIDDVIQAISIERDTKSFYLMKAISDSAFTPLVAKLEVQHAKKPSDYTWAICLGTVYEEQAQYEKAIGYYKKALSANPAFAAYSTAYCLTKLGFYNQAIEYYNQAIEADPEDAYNILLRASAKDYAGMQEEAMADINLYLSKEPDSYYGYYRRGYFKKYYGDFKGALEDFSTAIALEPNYASSYFNRGLINRTLGNETDAIKDFEQVLAMDTVISESSSAQYALYYLGEKEKAIAWQEKILEQNNNAGNNYNAACIFSVLGEKEKALSFLRKAFEKGYRNFVHIRRDHDLDAIRELAEYKELLKEYEQKHKEAQEKEEVGSAYTEAIMEIPFVKEGDMFKIQCAVNDLPLHFIFDTGASIVSLSTVEATFMLKNGYLSPADIMEKHHYMTASGEIREGTIVNLRNVSFGSLNLDNIRASVVKNQNAPLLLGQSVLNRLGTIEIDNEKKILKVTYKKFSE